MVSDKLHEIDFVRGVTIFLVVLLHAGFEGVVSDAMASFRMPLFFIVSGYLFSGSKYFNNKKRLFRNKTRTLLLPYASFCILSGLIYNLKDISYAEELGIIKISYGVLLGMFYGNGISIIGNVALWFLVCLFCTFLLFSIIFTLTQKHSIIVQWTVFILFGVAGYGIGNAIWLPLSFDIALTALPFMFFGYFLKEKRILYNHKITLPISIISLILLIAVVLFNGQVDMNNREYGNLILFYLGAISGSMLVIFTSKYILVKSKLLYLVFSYIGKNSLIILGLHLSVGFTFVSFFEKTLQINIGYFITSILAIIISLILERIISKISLLSLLFRGENLTIKKFKFDANQLNNKGKVKIDT